MAYGSEKLRLDEQGCLTTPADEAFERYELIRARDALISRLRRLVQAKRRAQRSRGPRRRINPGLGVDADGGAGLYGLWGMRKLGTSLRALKALSLTAALSAPSEAHSSG